MRTVLAMLLVGCAATEPLERAAKTGAEFAAVAEPILVDVYEQQQQACLKLDDAMQKECIADVRRRWRPMVETYDAFRKSYCLLDQAIGDARCKP